MKTPSISIQKSVIAPENSIILKDFGKVNYIDSYQIASDTNESVDQITTALFRPEKWVNNLMLVRNLMVKTFGLKTGENQGPNIAEFYPVGSKAVSFTVIERNDQEIVMEEDDLHLKFRTSVLIDRKDNQILIHLTTLVEYHNIWGRIYFFPVKPFHQIILKSALKRYHSTTFVNNQI